jgi:hypothetical protein
MKAKAGRKYLVPLAIGVGIWIGYLVFSPAKENLEVAANKNYISLAISASDESSAQFAMSLLPDGPSDLTVVIPAGTVIQNQERDGQWLMTAHAVTVHLTRGQPQSTQQIETYCLDQFAATPNLNSSLSLPPGIGSYHAGTTVEELDPIQKLSACLDDSVTDRHARELAVWMLANHRTTSTYDEVKTDLRNQFALQATRGIDQAMNGDLLQSLRQQFPKFSEERLQQELNYYREHTLHARIDAEADAKANEEITDFVQKARPLLERCGQKTSEMAFFQTLPNS